MLTYDLIVIGFGKAGKTLAAKMAVQGKKVALIERSKAMYGGTCINIACIPTKTLLVAAEKGLAFDQVMAEKNAVTSRLNGKNYAAISGAGVDIIDGEAHFLSNKVIEITAGDEKEELTAETIVINTGAVSNVLPIPGLTETEHVYDSTGIQNLKELPKRLGVLGGGNIGLEFAGLYNKLGSQVTVLDAAPVFLPRVEPSIAALAKQYMEEDGIQLLQNVRTTQVKNEGDEVVVVERPAEALVKAFGAGLPDVVEERCPEEPEVHLVPRAGGGECLGHIVHDLVGVGEVVLVSDALTGLCSLQLEELREENLHQSSLLEELQPDRGARG